MLRYFYLLLITTALMACDYSGSKLHENLISYVNPMLGTAGDGKLLPVASVPFGMVQLGPDTHLNNSGYKYDANKIEGFSHTHISGAGCIDFKDIMFFPVPD